MSLYDRVLARPGGERALAVARLKHTILSTLHRAFKASGIASQSDLARRLRVRRSAVNQVLNGDGNLRISTLAEYLHEMGYELNVTLVRSGEPRDAEVEGRPIFPEVSVSGGAVNFDFSTLLLSAAALDFTDRIQGTVSRVVKSYSDISETRSMLIRSWNLEGASDAIYRGAFQSMSPSSQITMTGHERVRT